MTTTKGNTKMKSSDEEAAETVSDKDKAGQPGKVELQPSGKSLLGKSNKRRELTSILESENVKVDKTQKR